MASAIGLGDITLHSALNQPLNAEIQVIAPGDLASHEVTVRLASPEAYARAGVERFVALGDLRFTPILQGRRSIIRVVSSKPVREPYLNFIVEVVRPGGSLLREYTLLLDPADSTAYRTLAAPQPVAEPVRQAPRVNRAPVARVAPPAVQGKQYQVQRGDSLWSIARRVQAAGNGQSQAELMSGIQALNPDAFIGGDSHRLIAGKVLRLPDAAQAPAEVGVSAPALAPAAPPVDTAQPLPATPAAANEGPSLQQLNEAQQRLEVELNNQATEKLQLQQGVAQLEQKLDALEQQLRSKDEQLAALQAQLASSERVETPPAAVLPAAPAADNVAPAPAPALETQNEQGFSLAWIGAALVLLLAALLALLTLRNRRDRQVAAQPVPVAPAAEVLPPAVEVLAEAKAAPLPARSVTTPSDDLDGAELYLAYGRYGAALSILRKLAHRQPQRTDVQLRLLDVLGQMGDAGGFARQLVVLSGLGVAAELVEPIKARYPQLAEASATDEREPPAALLDEPVAASEVAEAPVLPEDFQLNLDELSLDADWDLVSPFKAKQKARADELPELDADFRSNLNELPDVEELQSFEGFDGGLVVDAAPLDETLDAEFLDVFDDPELSQGRVGNDLSHLAGDRDNVVKLNLALAYIEQGNVHGACDILNEVISDGSPEQQREARALLARIA
ncbi:LysM peptidoglycan-binding domain-containing protein [Pseudomonas sp. UL073]|uniref:LysM peptidoglycan-binding domain-containing protein n=1 Tax=Zestomonas insulae TaxID=2809017 RepID=A0ABS2ICQ8_9GAMM|nr:FimV/HubP family polar landmark protein [Pseudomonas insulae]MBM7060805.1 LysM peptidoglycan-binding domain-containing protein [Pseudomonas insulae]